MMGKLPGERRAWKEETPGETALLKLIQVKVFLKSHYFI
jgi:hypothetical protein